MPNGVDILAEQSRGAVTYCKSLRDNTRALWTGSIDFDQYWEAMTATIKRRLPQAWHEGALEAGILPVDLTPNERMALQNAIVDEMSHITKFAAAIEEGSRARGGKLKPLLSRTAMWCNRYEELRMKARALAGADMKVRWDLGDAEHCKSCLRLDGKVKRNSYWLRKGILPKVAGAPYLECKGFKCQCTLTPTDERCSPGPLPKLP